jgi:hypothetical protein
MTSSDTSSKRPQQHQVSFINLNKQMNNETTNYYQSCYFQNNTSLLYNSQSNDKNNNEYDELTNYNLPKRNATKSYKEMPATPIILMKNPLRNEESTIIVDLSNNNNNHFYSSLYHNIITITNSDINKMQIPTSNNQMVSSFHPASSTNPSYRHHFLNSNQSNLMSKHF